jgi:hypothetical protein
VQGVVAGAGNAVGAVFQGAGNGVSGVGRGAGNAVSNAATGQADVFRRCVLLFPMRPWSQRTDHPSAFSYGNAIKDASGASGSRAATSSNPLGIAGAKGTFAPSSGTAVGQRNAGKGTAGNPLGI